MPKRKESPTDLTHVSDRSLPANINAEAAVMSAMLIDRDACTKGIEKLKEEYLYRSSHKIIFRLMQELFYENSEIDAITLINRLERANQLDKVGGIPYLNELTNVVVSSANFDYHLNIVMEQALLRQLIIASNGIIEACYQSDKPVRTIVDEAEQSIFAIAEMPKDQGFSRISDIVPEVLAMVEQVAATHLPIVGIPTGFADLDKLTGGFRPGQFIVIAARPAMGKTAFALNIAAYAAMDLNKKVAVFTMEMAKDEILMRMFSSASEVSMDAMMKGFGMNEDKIVRIAQVADGLSSKAIYIDDAGTNTPLDIRAKTRRLAAEIGGLDLIIIDYLQLMTAVKAKDNRQQEISEISRALKILAKDMKIPVVALSQLNRSLENRDDKRPRLADLRESGAIEQDSDLVMFIYRDEYYYPDKTEKPGTAEIIIGKNRHGATGTTDLAFVREFTLFRNLDTSHDF
jgi:replicative DNA helicase